MNSFCSSIYLYLLSGLLLLLPSVQAKAEPTVGATLAAALQRSAENNPTLTAQRFSQRAAEALIEQAGLRPNPTLDVTVENFLGTGPMQGVRHFETTVQASQTIERGGKREKRIALAGRGHDTAVKEFAVRRSEVIAATSIAYLNVIAAQQHLALTIEPLNLARATLGAAEARVKAGAASPAESARARVAIAAAQAEYARSQAALASARSALAATWGGLATDVGPLSGELHIPEIMPTEEDFLAGLGRHPKLELQQAIVAGHRAAFEFEQSQAVPDVTVGGGLRFLREESDAAFVAGISMPLPFRNRNQGNIRAARETMAGAEQSARASEIELRAALTAAWQDLTAAHRAAQSLRHDALPATEAACTAVRHAYDQGQLPLIDLLDAQRALVAIRREILNADYAYALSLARAESLTAPSFPALTALLHQP